MGGVGKNRSNVWLKSEHEGSGNKLGIGRKMRS
ncbi:hypothetical protein CCACVL1_23545 [Corchorus capsularis]|uniref:Uncharacterized protein n=1 Tax=Corchorus capsularis TaxID=210143 RepID=A0A1R3GTL2_COCAP|nr:hypothetical protein CCACVL1_23545 [Corchorus capsularis]